MKSPANKINISIGKVRAAIERAGTMTRAAVELKVSHHVLRRILAESGECKALAPRAKAKRKTLDDFRTAYDKSFIVPARIKAGVEKYLAGGYWETDQNFRELCRVPPHLWRRYADGFEQYQIRVDGKILWAEPDMIDKMREMTL